MKKISITSGGKHKSFVLFLTSAGIVILTFLVSMYWEALQLGANKVPLALSLTVAFGISIAGIIIGISELRAAKIKKLWAALIGNLLILLFFFYMAGYAMMTM